MKLSDYLATATSRLKQADIDSAQLDARLLAGHVLGLDRAQLLSQSDRTLTNMEIAKIDDLIARREQREPVARIIGHREFWSLPFALNEATLEPRPDSETLVEAVLKIKNDARRILDLGTGTGCLLSALLLEMPQATGLGIDIDPRAVEQATHNAASLNLSSRAEFRKSSWLDEVEGTFDLVVSNPPYIPSQDIEDLMPDVRDYDPPAALDGGEDGLDPYRILIPQIPSILNPGGLVAFEFGQGQAEAVTALLRLYGFRDIALHKDLGGIDRCVTASL